MSAITTRDELKAKIDRGDDFKLVEALAEDAYKEWHLPGAINIPLKQLDASSAARLDRNRPVLVYCNDFG